MNFNLRPYQSEILEQIKHTYYKAMLSPFDEFWDSLPVQEPKVNTEPFDRFLGLV